jgi:hypothetical protein
VLLLVLTLLVLAMMLLLKLWRVSGRFSFWGRIVIRGIIRGGVRGGEETRGVYDCRGGREMVLLLRLRVLRTVVIGRLRLI